MRPLLKTLWVLWCAAFTILVVAGLSHQGIWPPWTIGGPVLALFGGQVVFGRLISKAK
jgi:hypothetical protein